MMDWLVANWLGLVSLMLTIFFGIAGASYYFNKSSHSSKITHNTNSGKGDQYNAGRDINLNRKDKE